MAQRILTGTLIPQERNGTARIHFNPHRVTGEARGADLEASGRGGDFITRPGKVVSIREFRVEDKDTFWGDSEGDWFRINDHNWTNTYLDVSWSCEAGARLQEISYLITGEVAIVNDYKKCLETIADLKAIPNTDLERHTQVVVLGYYEVNDNGGGIFYYDPDSDDTPDNGMVFLPTDQTDTENGRWLRLGSDRRINILWFGARGDGDPESSNINDAALLNALTFADRLKNSNLYPIKIYFPETGDEYFMSGFEIIGRPRIILEGDPGLINSRLRLMSTVDGACLRISEAGNSWNGLLNIRIEAGVVCDSVIDLACAHNGAFLDGVYIYGNGFADNGLKVNGGSRLILNNLYTSGFHKFNFVFENIGTSSLFDMVTGNHDVGEEGFLKIISEQWTGPVSLINQRLEDAPGGKRVIQHDSPGGGYLNIIGSYLGGGPEESVIHAFNGAVRVYMNLVMQTRPQYLYTQSDRPEANIRYDGESIPLSMSFNCPITWYNDLEILSRDPEEVTNLYMQRRDGYRFQIFPDADELNIKIKDDQYLLVAGERGLRTGDYRQPEEGLEGIQISGEGRGLTIDNGYIQLSGQKMISGSAQPVLGIGRWNKGDIVWNSNPSPGGNVGWICTEAGDPGIWRVFGCID